MTLVRFSLFGGFDCRSRDDAALVFPTRKVRALAAYLAVNAGNAQTRDRLAQLLWDDGTDAQARTNLRKGLSRLRQALPDPARHCLLLQTDRVSFRPEGVEVDAVLFGRLIAEGTPDSLERSIELYRGEFLEGFAQCGEAFEGWMMAERRRFGEMLRDILQRLLDHYMLTGSIDRAIQLALRLTALDPLQESVHRTLIRLYLYQGRVGSALDQYERCRDILAGDLGVEPSAETEQLKAAILRKADGTEGGREPQGDGNRPADPTALFRAEIGRHSRLPAKSTGRPSIAVLSFAVADNDSHRHLGDALADDIAAELGHFNELEVIPLVGARTHRQVGIEPERTGTELDMTYVVDGRLRQVGKI